MTLLKYPPHLHFLNCVVPVRSPLTQNKTLRKIRLDFIGQKSLSSSLVQLTSNRLTPPRISPLYVFMHVVT
jgi:hypothetical protein